MAYRDLSEFLAYLDKRGVLRHIEVAVSRDLEIATIAARTAQMTGGGPALLFENVSGYRMPVLVNGWSTPQRMAWVLGLTSLDQLTARYREMLSANPTASSDRLVQLGASSDLVRFAPRQVKTGLCQEVVVEAQNTNFEMLPILQHPDAPQRVLTDAQIFYRDPHTHKTRLALADLSVISKNRAVLTPHPFGLTAPLFDTLADFAIGTRLPIACALGGDPTLLFAALAPLPPFLDELTLAGYLRRSRIETVSCKTSDLEVPAQAELVLEGFLTRTPATKSPNTRSGFQHNVEAVWNFELTALTMRRQPIFTTTVLGTPYTESGLLKAIERALLPFLQQVTPALVDVSLPPAGLLHNLAIVAIKKRYAGQAQQVMNALWGGDWLKTVKTLVVVDADCDIQNFDQVVWRVAASLNPKHDLLTLPGLLSNFDHTAFGNFGSKLGIDATRKLPGESLGVGDDVGVVQLDTKTREMVDAKWPSYGID